MIIIIIIIIIIINEIKAKVIMIELSQYGPRLAKKKKKKKVPSSMRKMCGSAQSLNWIITLYSYIL